MYDPNWWRWNWVVFLFFFLLLNVFIDFSTTRRAHKEWKEEEKNISATKITSSLCVCIHFHPFFPAHTQCYIERMFFFVFDLLARRGRGLKGEKGKKNMARVKRRKKRESYNNFYYASEPFRMIFRQLLYTLRNCIVIKSPTLLEKKSMYDILKEGWVWRQHIATDDDDDDDDFYVEREAQNFRVE